MEMEIYIPTRGRVFQETYQSLTEGYILDPIGPKIKFVVPYGSDHLGRGERVLETPPHINGIGPTRQWIIDYAADRGVKKVAMLDDDLVFATRRQDEPTKFQPSSPGEICALFRGISAYLDLYAHVGVATREGGNRDTSDSVCNTRLLRILAYRVDVLRREEIRFDRLELMEDFDVTLQLLRRGYPNLKINWIVHNQRSSNAPGGCSTYRTLEKQSANARGLAALHEDFVTTVQKKTKTAWNGKERTDVIIQWKRAFCADTAGVAAVLDPGTEPSVAEEGTGPTETME